MRLAVSGTATNRPDYFEQVLESWSSTNLKLIETLIWNVEPIDPGVIGQARGWAREESRVKPWVFVNPRVYGAAGNPWYALDRAFNYGADFVIVAEDDSIVSPDILEFFDWAAHEYEADASVFAVCSFDHLGLTKAAGSSKAYRSQEFCPTVWGTWRDRWDGGIRSSWDWTGCDEHVEAIEGRPKCAHHPESMANGWDWKFTDSTMAGRQCIRPCVSRSQHIGELGGSHPQNQFEYLASKSFTITPDPVEAWSEV